MQRLYTDWTKHNSTNSILSFIHHEVIFNIDGGILSEIWKIVGADDYAWRIQLTGAEVAEIETTNGYHAGPLVGHYLSPDTCKRHIKLILDAAGFRLIDAKALILR